MGQYDSRRKCLHPYNWFPIRDTYRALDTFLEKLGAGQIGHSHHGGRRNHSHPGDDFFKVAWQYAHLLCHNQYCQSASSFF